MNFVQLKPTFNKTILAGWRLLLSGLHFSCRFRVDILQRKFPRASIEELEDARCVAVPLEVLHRRDELVLRDHARLIVIEALLPGQHERALVFLPQAGVETRHERGDVRRKFLE